MPTKPLLTGLRVSPRVQVFRAVERILREDPILGRQVKVWRTWEGRDEDKNELAIDEAPAIRLTPRPSNQTWWSTDAMVCVVEIGVEIRLQGTCYDDLDNLWYAIERAIYPTDVALRQKFQSILSNAGAHVQLAQFQPAFDPSFGSDGNILAQGAIRIDVRMTLTS